MVDPTDNTTTTTPLTDTVQVETSEGSAPSVKKRSRTSHNNNNGLLLQEEEVDHNDVLELEKNNPLYIEQYKFLKSLSDVERDYFFSNNGNINSEQQQQQQQYDKKNSISTTRRSEIWELQNQIGTQCINQYAWVTPNQQCLHIMAHFIPLIEIGCGTNAYWCQQLISYYCQNTTGTNTTSTSSSVMGSNDPINVNDIIVGYDISPIYGGKIIINTEDDEDKNDTDTPLISKPSRSRMLDPTITKTKFQVLYGGPNVLAYPEHVHRTLFLCYPDENNPDDENVFDQINHHHKMTPITKIKPHLEPDDEKDGDDDGDGIEVNEDDNEDDAKEQQYSMAYECMKYYTGDIIIHVGELMHVLSPIIGNDTAPYGRTSSIQFQEYLFTHFHCILQYKLPLNWLHTNNDYLTVWKRSTNLTTIVYSSSNNTAEDNENDDTETDNPKANYDTDNVNDDNEEEEEEVQYRHIPYEERLPIINVAAPCVQHLWLSKK